MTSMSPVFGKVMASVNSGCMLQVRRSAMGLTMEPDRVKESVSTGLKAPPGVRGGGDGRRNLNFRKS